MKVVLAALKLTCTLRDAYLKPFALLLKKLISISNIYIVPKISCSYVQHKKIIVNLPISFPLHIKATLSCKTIYLLIIPLNKYIACYYNRVLYGPYIIEVSLSKEDYLPPPLYHHHAHFLSDTKEW